MNACYEAMSSAISRKAKVDSLDDEDNKSR